MNWQEITISEDGTHFLSHGKLLFGKKYIEVLKFHSPGLAPVKDETGGYHIDISGNPAYPERYQRTFGYYCNRAAVILDGLWFHLDEKGQKVYQDTFLWAGNFQEDLCPVRDENNRYFHIHLDGEQISSSSYLYAGDFKDGIACVKTDTGAFRHIKRDGGFLHNKMFLDLGIFHKNFATARDESGWFHIHKDGRAAYPQRFSSIEPFYNGYALITQFDGKRGIIDEQGEMVLMI